MKPLALRDQAKLFRWGVHVDRNRREDTFICGENMIAVNYKADGSVREAQRYTFFRADDLHIQEHASGGNKKATILSWLAQYGT